MQVQNIIPDFLTLKDSKVDSKVDFTIADLDIYFDRHPEIFTEYFPNHCPKTEERLRSAIVKYSDQLNDIRMIAKRLQAIIGEIETMFNNSYHLDLDLGYKMIVGTFGSNAFVTRSNKREIYFAVEKLSAKTDHLKVIVAHEIGHTAHFTFATQQGMNWQKVDWTNGLTTLYTEGAATYLSEKVVPGLNESIYFTYDDDGYPWVTCYKENRKEVKQRFLNDVSSGWDMVKEREWFRLSGGSYFEHNRLGYLLGTNYVKQLVEKIGEEAALTFWNANDLKEDILRWLKE